jgi:flagellar basal body-associated protein FliL
MDKKRIYIIIIVCLVAVLGIGGVYMLFSNNTAKSTLTNVNS